MNNIIKGKKYFEKKEYINDIKASCKDNVIQLTALDFKHLLDETDRAEIAELGGKVRVITPPCTLVDSVCSSLMTRTKEDVERENRFEHRKNANEIAKNLTRSRIPQKYLGMGSGDIAKVEGLEDVFKVFKRYMENHEDFLRRGVGVFMFGGVGSGKTLTTCVLVKKLVEMGYKALFYDTTDLFNTIKSTFKPSSNLHQSDILKEILQAPILMLEDLGAEKPSEWVLDVLFYIINERYKANKTTFITTNYTQKELITRLGEKNRILSRLIEKNFIVANKAPDYRIVENNLLMGELR